MPPTTRTFDTAGPYGHVPGAAPPMHSAQVDPAEEAEDPRGQLSRVSGRDDTLNTAGWVGYSDRPGADGAAYRGRDLSDPSTFNGRPYNEAPGMFARLQEEASNGG